MDGGDKAYEPFERTNASQLDKELKWKSYVKWHFILYVIYHIKKIVL